MDSKGPEVSIVIPCFNHTDLLSECLASVVAQSFERWEAIVVDDCSTVGDPSAVVRGFADVRIRVIRHEQNKGLAAARNTGIRSAKADLILPLDSDDCLEPRFLDETIEVLEADRDVDCVFSDLQVFGDVDEVWRYSLRSPETILETQWIPGPGTLMRKRVWVSVGGYCESDELRIGNEDWDFWIGAVDKGVRAAHISRPLYRYRRKGSSMSTRLAHNDHVTRRAIVERHKEFFSRHGGWRAFLAQGYLRSSYAASASSRKLRALKLVFVAAVLLPTDRRIWSHLVKLCLPESLKAWGRRLAS